MALEFSATALSLQLGVICYIGGVQDSRHGKYFSVIDMQSTDIILCQKY